MISIVKCKKPFPMKKSKRSYVFRCKFKKNVLKRVLGLELGPYVCEVNQINQKRRSPRPEADLFCVMRSASPEPAPASPSPQYQPAPAPTQFSKMWFQKEKPAPAPAPASAPAQARPSPSSQGEDPAEGWLGLRLGLRESGAGPQIQNAGPKRKLSGKTFGQNVSVKTFRSKRFGQNFRSKLSVKTFRSKRFGQNFRSKRFGQNFRSKLSVKTYWHPNP